LKNQNQSVKIEIAKYIEIENMENNWNRCKNAGQRKKQKGQTERKRFYYFYLTIFLAILPWLLVYLYFAHFVVGSVGGFRHFTSNFLFWPEENQSGQETSGRKTLRM